MDLNHALLQGTKKGEDGNPLAEPQRCDISKKPPRLDKNHKSLGSTYCNQQVSFLMQGEEKLFSNFAYSCHTQEAFIFKIKSVGNSVRAEIR